MKLIAGSITLSLLLVMSHDYEITNPAHPPIRQWQLQRPPILLYEIQSTVPEYLSTDIQPKPWLIRSMTATNAKRHHNGFDGG